MEEFILTEIILVSNWYILKLPNAKNIHYELEIIKAHRIWAEKISRYPCHVNLYLIIPHKWPKAKDNGHNQIKFAPINDDKKLFKYKWQHCF